MFFSINIVSFSSELNVFLYHATYIEVLNIYKIVPNHLPNRLPAQALENSSYCSYVGINRVCNECHRLMIPDYLIPLHLNTKETYKKDNRIETYII